MKLDLDELCEMAGVPTSSIRELIKQRREALLAYHAECNRIDAEIEAIRNKRGTKLKDYSNVSYYEPGRDRKPTSGLGGEM